MITIKSCPVCNSSDIIKYQTVKSGIFKAGIIPSLKVDTTIFTHYSVCQNCSLVFQNPRLSDEELNRLYSSGLYRQVIGQLPEGTDASEASRAKIDAEIIRKYIGKIKTYLDVGCGRGYLLEAVDADVKTGVESDINYITAKDVKVYSEMDQIPPKKFDLVSAIHVLEHVPYPLDFLRKMVRLTKKSGYLVIEVPGRKTSGGPLGFAHLYYFEPDVLRLMCKGLGLRIVETEFTPHLLLICKND